MHREPPTTRLSTLMPSWIVWRGFPAAGTRAYAPGLSEIFLPRQNIFSTLIVSSSSAPGTPAPTPYSPSPGHQLDPGQVAASIAKLREEVSA